MKDLIQIRLENHYKERGANVKEEFSKKNNGFLTHPNLFYFINNGRKIHF